MKPLRHSAARDFTAREAAIAGRREKFRAGPVLTPLPRSWLLFAAGYESAQRNLGR